jgi:hypothetical protein
MADSEERFQVYAVTELRRAGKGLPVYCDGGGPLDGTTHEIPLLGAGVIASRDVADGCGASVTVDYFYRRTATKRADGRFVCRYDGRRRRP